MKELADGTTVIARTYYYLLDFNDWDNWKFLFETFGKKRLCDLNITEFRILFKHATESDYMSLK